MLKTLRERNFALLWTGGIISGFGDWLLLVALPIFVYNLSGSSLATGAMFIIQILPRVLLAPVAGVFVDRWDRKRVMVISDIIRGVVLLSLLFVQSTDLLWIVYLVALVMSSVAQFFGPADSALVPSLVEKENLIAANSLTSLAANLTRLAGPALGGLLMEWIGFNAVIVLDSISFFFSALLIGLITKRATAQAQPAEDEPAATSQLAGIWQEFWDGLQVVRRDPMLVAIFLVVGLAMPAEGIMQVLLVIFVENILGGSAQHFGLMYSADGIGSLLGSFGIVWAQRTLPPNRLVGVSAILLGLIMVAQFNILSLNVFLILSILVGIVQVGVFVSMTTLVQMRVPEQYLGRVFASFVTVVSLSTLAGLLFASFLGDALSTQSVLNIAAGITIAAGALALVLLRNAARREALSVETEAA
ncbi:MAG TPA: MFS transporter [Herpetosiphonaceae bacterium]